MKYLSTFLFFFLFAIGMQAQAVSVTDDNTIYEVTDQVATYPGGEGAWNLYVANNMKYPEYAMSNKIAGTVIMSFVVEKTGKITNFKAIDKVDTALEEESVMLIRKSGPWKPALLKGQPVRSRVVLPVRFEL